MATGPTDIRICMVFKELILYSWLALGYNGSTFKIRTFCLARHVANLLEG